MSRTYKLGNRFKYTFDNESFEYILARTRRKEWNEPTWVGLINLETGNMWSDGIKVCDSKRITEEELRTLIGKSTKYFKGIDNEFNTVPSHWVTQSQMLANKYYKDAENPDDTAVYFWDMHYFYRLTEKYAMRAVAPDVYGVKYLVQMDIKI